MLYLILFCLIFIQLSGNGDYSNFYEFIFILTILTVIFKLKIFKKDYHYIFSLILLLFISAFISDYQYIDFESIKDYSSFAIALVIPFLIYPQFKDSNYKLLNKGIVIMFLLISLAGLYEYIFHTNFLYPNSKLIPGRISGGNSLSIPWAGYISVFSLGSIYYFFRKKVIIFSLFIIIICFNIYATGQRMALVLFFCSMLLIFIYDKSFRKYIYLYIIVILICFSSLGFNNRSDSSIEMSIIDEQKSKRLAIYSATLELSSENVLFGIGLENIYKKYQRYKDDYSEISSAMHPHSLILYVLLKIGLLGLLVYSFFIINLFLSIMRMEIFYIVISLLYFNVLFNPLQVSHSFNEVWFVLLFIVGLSIILFSKVNIKKSKGEML